MSKLDRLLARLPDGSLMAGEKAYGRTLRVIGDHPIGRRVIAKTHQQMARAIATVLKAAELQGDLSAVELSKKTMEKFFAPLLDVVEESGDTYTFTFSRCPYSLQNGELALCHAIMNLEEELVHELGGELLIEKRLAGGDGHCRFSVQLKRYHNPAE